MRSWKLAVVWLGATGLGLPGGVCVAAGQSGPTLPVPVIDLDEAALVDLSYFSAAAIGELTGDGVADVLLTRRGPGGTGEGQLSVYRGDGAGGLTLVGRLGISGDPTSVLLADATGDGRLDALVTDGAASTLSIYAQRAAGRFELVETITTGRTPIEAALRDVTGDGVADLLVCNYDHYFVGLHAGLAGGGFAPPARLAVGLRPADMAVVDVDGDGDLDVLTADELSDTVSLLVNEGGAFAPAVVAVSMPRATSLDLADLDGDGLPEMVVAGGEGVRLYRNEGGTFVPASAGSVSSGSGSRHLLLEDVDADGHADLVLGTNGGAEVFPGVAGGLAETAEHVLTAGGFVPRSGGVFAGRLSGADGLDLILVEPHRVSAILAAEGVPAGVVGLWTPLAMDAGRASGEAVGQFTGDAIPDVLIVEGDGSRLLVGLGGGAFAEPAGVRGFSAREVKAARLRPGTLDDVLVLTDTLLLVRPDGAGGFGPPIGVVGGADAAAVGDVDGDGDLDVATAGRTVARVIYNDGLGNLTPGPRLDLPRPGGDVAIADVTGDGVADLVVAATDSGVGGTPIYVWPGIGGGTFGAMRAFDSGHGTHLRVLPIDVGDAGAGLIVEGSRVVELWRDLGASSPTRTSILTTFDTVYAAQVVDVDGDGRQDLVLAQIRSGVTIWRQGPGATLERRAAFGLFSQRVQLVEATGDGALDALLGSGSTRLGVGKPGRFFPCPADLDGDGVLTLFDFLEFQTLFDAGDPLADFDGDGALTVFDFLQFQNLFDLGCP